ncbi:hypothetical protein TVAG_290600 [Trichomonas vaginalis G3]|uniref:DnaK protein n=1 Tax=Trichomonas vaginalis (strain ATCC PRA-98 / G3) TaxID=412133 RepID=A2EQU4_TRIV3|nr:hypothetical protein TVAGG3_0243690 [Trichomonas vaginalis G3]EAY04990.1 hypothetical protein TVAG_290600 [Trichomonas vaginalis G3]KAI5553516.1 hypothetical protein TVAGG3_0243690 [Trichomonas vaginalis G3]|eukprot:XP_001317213.1 hypothetical protein [Trichomonas vaginalis G3]
MTAILQLGNSTTYYYIFSEETKKNTSMPSFYEYKMDFGLHQKDFRSLEDQEVNQTTCPHEKYSVHEFLRYIGEKKVVINDPSQNIKYTAEDCLSLILHMIINRIRAKYIKKLQYYFIIDPNWDDKKIEALQDCINDNNITDYKIVSSDDMISNLLNLYFQDQEVNEEKHTIIINSGATGTDVFIVETKQHEDPKIIKKSYINKGHIDFTNILCNIFLSQFENDKNDDQTNKIIAEIKDQKPNPSKRCFFNEVSKLSQTMAPHLKTKLSATSLSYASFTSDIIAYDDVIGNPEYGKLAEDFYSFIQAFLSDIGNLHIDYFTIVGGNSLNPFFKQLVNVIIDDKIKKCQELCLNNSRCSAISGTIDLLSRKKIEKFVKKSVDKKANRESFVDKILTKKARKQYDINKKSDEFNNQYDSIPNFKSYFTKLGIELDSDFKKFLDSYIYDSNFELDKVIKEINVALEKVRDKTDKEFIQQHKDNKLLKSALTAARDAMTNNQKQELLSYAENIYALIHASETLKEEFEKGLEVAKKSRKDKEFAEEKLQEFCDYLDAIQNK